MVLKRLLLHIVLLLGILAIGVSATADLGEFGVREERLGTAGGHFGYAVAVSGDSALVGQPDDHTQAAHAGAAYVYERRQGQWVKVARLLPSGNKESKGARFGSAVAIDGNMAIVGADGENNDRGAAYLFEQRQGVWTRVGKLTISNAAPKTYFGRSVAMAGDYALVGAPGDSKGGKQAGAVYVFQRQQGVWGGREVQKLLARDAKAYYGFGARLALTGSYALVGSPEHDDGGHSSDNYGAAYVFELSEGVWREAAKLQASDGVRRDYFGSAVAISGYEALVGAYKHDRKGAAYLFTRQAGTWTTTEVHKFTTRDSARGDHFGAAVALSGNVILIGAYGHDADRHHDDDDDHDSDDDDEHDGDDDDDDDAHRERSGAAYVFERQAAGWMEVEKLPARQALKHAHFGYAVALSEQYALVGAPALLGSSPGRVYVYSNFVSAPNQPPRITSLPVTSAEVFHVIPQVTISDAHLARQTITLNGQPYTPGTPITVDGDYILTVEATDVAGNTSVTTLRFSIRRPPVP